jgi:plasmid stabilization system protein ParE
MPVVTRTPQAEDDILDWLVRLGRLSVPAADRFRDALDRVSRTLTRSPRLGTPRPDLGSDLYSHPFARKYIVYYRMTDTGIEIARVLSGAIPPDASMFNG